MNNRTDRPNVISLLNMVKQTRELLTKGNYSINFIDDKDFSRMLFFAQENQDSATYLQSESVKSYKAAVIFSLTSIGIPMVYYG
jgi:hypothetical protein